MKSVCSFLCLPKETNQRKGPRVSCPAEGGIPGVYAPHGVLLDAAGALQTRCAQTVQIPFSAASPVLGYVPMGILSPPFVLPRLADGGGKRRGNCLRAKPEFFRVPPSTRSKGSPQGQDWLGCLFLVSSFGHAKEEKENGRKASRLFPEFPDEPFIKGEVKSVAWPDSLHRPASLPFPPYWSLVFSVLPACKRGASGSPFLSGRSWRGS
jgi:hypothetical protein